MDHEFRVGDVFSVYQTSSLNGLYLIDEIIHDSITLVYEDEGNSSHPLQLLAIVPDVQDAIKRGEMLFEGNVFDAINKPVTPPGGMTIARPCTCDIGSLFNFGCKCGGV